MESHRCLWELSDLPPLGGGVSVVLLGKMAEVLEVLWQKLRVTEEEEKSVTLGRD